MEITCSLHLDDDETEIIIVIHPLSIIKYI